jgi:hypothetical protein
MGHSTDPNANRDRLNYEDLKHKDSIRILKLEPAQTSDEELCASFCQVGLEEALSYEAISYTWGAEAFPETSKFPAGCLKSLTTLHRP